jgi:hypothetical protein
VPPATDQITKKFPLLFLLVFSANAALAQAPQTTPALTPTEETQLHDLAVRVLKHTDSASCKKNSCAILVTNFSGPTRSTSALGIQLADEVSDQLRSLATGVEIVDRNSFLEFLSREHIPSRLLAERNAARWLAMKMSANAVVVGELTVERTALHLTVRLLDAHMLEKQNDKTIKREEKAREEVNLTDLGNSLDLASLEQLGKSGTYPFGVEISGQTKEFFRAGVDGVGVPSCRGQANPNFTNEARIARVNGSIVAEVLVTSEGQVIEPRIVSGLPFGLNDSARSTLVEWRCDAAKKGEVPVTVLVPIEVFFRIF